MQNILILFAVASTVVTVAVFIGKVPADTIHAFNEHLRSGVRQGRSRRPTWRRRRRRNGYTGLAPTSLFWTLMVMTWIYLNLSFMSSSAYIGSEVKNARKLQLWSMPATLFIVGFGVLISVLVIDHAVGYNFLAQLGWADPTGLGFESAPTFTELAAFVGNNIWIAFIILFGFIFWSYAWLPGQILNGSRNIFAYSLDGLLPKWFKQVNPRFSTPVNSLLTMGIASIIALGIYVFTDLFSTLVGIFGFILSFIVISIAAARAALPAQGRVRDVGREPAHPRRPGDHDHRHPQRHRPGVHGLGVPARPERRPERQPEDDLVQHHRVPQRPRRVLRRQVHPAEPRRGRGSQLQAGPGGVTD